MAVAQSFFFFLNRTRVSEAAQRVMALADKPDNLSSNLQDAQSRRREAASESHPPALHNTTAMVHALHCPPVKNKP